MKRGLKESMQTGLDRELDEVTTVTPMKRGLKVGQSDSSGYRARMLQPLPR